MKWMDPKTKMTGKPYTMMEMKAIVEYLVEHKAYSEIKGRKMWMDFANSQLTTRTWQSLKETFLKRIMPDLHNPYYRLNIIQIQSFTSGKNMEDNNQNKLVIQTVTDDTSTNDNAANETDPKNNTVPDDAANPSGENIVPANISSRSRSSTDTLVLENFYNNAEEIQSVLENDESNKNDSKCLKDYIQFECSESFVPAVRKVIDDFATESENSDKEPQMEVAETVEIEDLDDIDMNNVTEIGDDIEISDNDVLVINENSEQNDQLQEVEAFLQNNDVLTIAKDQSETNKINDMPKDADVTATTNRESVDLLSTKTPNNQTGNLNTQNMSSNSADTLLPNNQEALNNNTQKGNENNETISNNEKSNKNDETQSNIQKQDKDTGIVQNKDNETGSKNEKQVKNIEKDPKNDKQTKTNEAVSKKQNKNTEIGSGNEKQNKNKENASKNVKQNKGTEASSKNENQNQTEDGPKNDKSNKNGDTVSKNGKPAKAIESDPKNENSNKTNGTSTKNDNSNKKTEAVSVNEKTTKNNGVDSKNDKQNANKDNNNEKPNENVESAPKIYEKKNTKKRTHSQDSKNSNTNKKAKVNEAQTDTAMNVDPSVIEIYSDTPNNETEDLINKDKDKSVVQEENTQLSQAKNPCLQSVSLFEEQFNTTKFTSSDDDVVTESVKPVENVPPNIAKCHLLKTMLKKDIVMLKSNSETEEEEIRPVTVKKSPKKVDKDKFKKQKKEALANAFGFSGGSRKRRLSTKKRSHRKVYKVPSASSEWSTESDSEEYISPPRGRRNKHTKKYLKPKSARILSLEEEGGLFVMHGNRIYPLVKDGKVIKNYLTYNPGSDSEPEEDSYWKQKYVEERMKSNELKKQLLRAPDTRRSTKSKTTSPILQSRHSRNTNTHKHISIKISDSDSNNTNNVNEVVHQEAPPKPEKIREEKIKITFAKNNREVQLEGHWQQIHPAIKEVVEIFQNDHEGNDDKKVSRKSSESGQTTLVIPVIDPDVHKKVNEIEAQIFKEIEQRDKEEKTKVNEEISNTNVNNVDNDAENVTKRKGRPKSESTTKIEDQNQAKRVKRSNSSTEASETSKAKKSVGKKSIEKDKPTETKTDIETRSSKRLSAPKKLVSEPEKKATRSVTTRKSKNKSQIDIEEEVRYMLPPKSDRQSKKSETNTRGRRSMPVESIVQDKSIDNTIGYQDSDVSPINMNKRKRKCSFKISLRKKRASVRSLPDLTAHFSDSSNSSYFIPKKSQSTLNSEVYKTESYQLLMPTQKVIKTNSLECIAENPCIDTRHFDGSKETDNSNIIVEIGSSSNVSLPMSPELSVVENLTLSREIIKSHSELLNEIQVDNNNEIDTYNKYMISDVDVSVPLMDQDCELVKSVQDTTNKSLLKKIESVNIKEKSLTDTLNTKLRDLFLESAKKMSNEALNVDKENVMEVDVETEGKTKKTRTKKRCSTPRKKKTSKVTKAPEKSIIIEERMESCASGRTSCPPAITFVPIDENANNCDDVTINKTTAKGRKKKDIIKVKIQRPKSRSREKIAQKNVIESICTDSGINDTSCISGLLKVTDDSVDLIHNHSETCLHAHECINNSVEFIENSKSILSINSSIENDLLKLVDDVDTLSEVLCNSNAQDVSTFENKTPDDFETPIGTVYHSPANSSLITEDLSDDHSPQPTKWYLLSEEETNTNQICQSQGFGANLKQIFPVTCAVPDLSTISERSKENEDSRKPTLDTDGDTRNCDSQSLF